MQQGDWGADVNLSVDPEESPGGGCEEVWEKYVFGLTLIDYIFDIFLGYIFIIYFYDFMNTKILNQNHY